MKRFNSTTEGVWIGIKPVRPTEEDTAILNSINEEDKEAREALRDELKAKREFEVEPETFDKLVEFYNSVKPELKEEDVYQLISIDLTSEKKTFSGLLNCRVNGEHRQIRF